jgi:hypothetical protein
MKDLHEHILARTATALYLIRAVIFISEVTNDTLTCEKDDEFSGERLGNNVKLSDVPVYVILAFGPQILQDITENKVRMAVVLARTRNRCLGEEIRDALVFC